MTLKEGATGPGLAPAHIPISAIATSPHWYVKDDQHVEREAYQPSGVSFLSPLLTPLVFSRPVPCQKWSVHAPCGKRRAIFIFLFPSPACSFCTSHSDNIRALRGEGKIRSERAEAGSKKSTSGEEK